MLAHKISVTVSPVFFRETSSRTNNVLANGERMTKDTKSPSEKREQLALLSDEVKQFHPFLHALLPKLPRMTKVDYTHGCHEKGADFVCTRTDDTLLAPEYIGVIAKTGKITKSLTDIYDQVDDCAQTRYTAGGKSQIQLDEIWVVTNESISNNAQEKIHTRFAVTKIKFFQHQDLARLVDEHLSHFWETEDVPIGEYLIQLRQDVEREEASKSLLPKHCKRFHVPLVLSPSELTYGRKKKRHSKATLEELITRQRITVVEGGAGSGKSHAVRSLVLEFANPSHYAKTRIVPMYATYAELYRSSDLDVAKFLDGPEFDTIRHELDSGATPVLFVDGFDELILEDRDVVAELRQLVKSVAAHDSLKLVLTTRPVNIVDFEEILPDRTPSYEIDPLSLGQIIEFFRHICKEASISERLLADIKDSDLFKQLPRNPISAILLAQIVNDNAEDLPSNITDVYTRFTQLMLGLWDIDKGLQSQKEYEATTSIIANIAAYCVENDLPALGDGEALGFFEDYLKRRNFDIVPQALYERTVSRSGILQRDDKRGNVAFKHRSFAEYFYALGKFRNSDPTFIDHRIYSVAWRTIYFFYVGLHKDCEDLLRRLLAISPASSSERFWRFVNMADYMLAAYATPYEVVETSLPLLINEARDLYWGIVHQEFDSPLDDLPEIIVLNFFEAVTNSAYGYRFFMRAADSAVVHILADNSQDRDKKAYALFFLSTLYRALGKENPFDGLLDEYDRDIPLPVQIGILYDSQQLKHQSTLLKRNEKRVKHEMKKNPQLRSYAKRLHEIPVGKQSRTTASTTTN